MPGSDVVKTKRDGALTFCDAGGFGGANLLIITKEIGDFSFSAPGPTRNDFLDRGRMDGSVRYGDDQPMSGSFSAYFRNATDTADESLMDLLLWDQAGTSYIDVNWVPTLGANAEVPTADLQYVVAGTIHGDGGDHSFIFADVFSELGSAGDGDPNTIQVNWASHAAGTAGIRPTRS